MKKHAVLILLVFVMTALFIPVLTYGVESVTITASGGILETGTYYVPDGGVTITNSITIDDGSEVIIDLKGNTLNSSLAKTIINNGTLTIKDTGTNGKINATFNGTIYGIYQSSKSTASTTIESGTISVESTSASGSMYGVYALKGSATMTGGTIQAYGPGGYSIYGMYGNSTTPAQISGGTINIEVTNEGKTPSPVGHGIVTGGKFSAYPASSVKLFNSTVTGGIFNFAPSDFVRVGTHKVQDGGVETYTYKTGGTYTYSVVVDETPTYYVQNMTTETKYANLQDAIDAATSGDTIKLLESYNSKNFAIRITKPIIFDLNGKTISGLVSGLVTVNGGTEENPVIITDSSATSHANAGTITSTLTPVKIFEGFCKIEKINITATSASIINGIINLDGLDANNKANLILRGVKIDIETTSASNNTGAVYYTSYSSIVSENFNDTFPTIMNVSGESATTSISIGIFHCASGPSDVTINSGLYTVSGNTSSAVERNIINTGAFIHNSNSAYPTAVMNINGGAFKVSSNVKVNISRLTTPTAVSNGSIFNFEPTAYLDIGCSATANDDDGTKAEYPWKIIRSNAAKIGEAEYITMQEAIDMAQADDTIELLRNEIVKTSLIVDKNITINKGDYSLTLNGNPAIILSDNVTMPTSITEQYVATITNSNGSVEYYTKLENAILAAIPGETIKLIANAETTATITINKNYTIDMNGFNITSTKANAFSYRGELMPQKSISVLFRNDNLQDRESIITGGINIEARGYNYTITIDDGVKVLANQPIVMLGNGNEECITLDIYGKLEVKEGSNYTAIQGSGNVGYAGTVVNIYEGAVINGGIYQPQAGVLNINGGTISGKSGIEIRAGELNVTRGTITGTGISTSAQANGTGSTTVGAGIAIAQHTTKLPINVSISGGTISGYTAIYESNPQENSEEDVAKITLEIIDGNFETTSGGTNIVYSENCKNFISGGLFKIVPDINYIASGYKTVTGQWGVYKYRVSEIVENKIETAMATVKSAEDIDTSEEISTVVDGTNIRLSGVVSSVNKIIVVGKCTDRKEVLFGNITYDGNNFIVATPASIVVDNTTYTIDTTGLTILPEQVAVIEAGTKIESSIQEPTAEETDIIDAIQLNTDKIEAEGLNIASSIIVTTTDGEGNSETTVKTGTNETQTIQEVITEAKNTEGAPTSIAGGDELTVVVKPIIKVEVKGVSVDGNGKKVIALDISTLSQVIVTTEEVIANGTEIKTSGAGQNAVLVGEPVPVKINTPMIVTIPLPNGSVTLENKDNIFIKHRMHNNEIETVSAAGDIDTQTVSFRINGMSPIEVVIDERTCTIDYVGTELSIQYRVDNVTEAFPEAPVREGYNMIGWKITNKDGENIEYVFFGITTYLVETCNAMSDRLLTILDGQTVDATPVYVRRTGKTSTQKEDKITWTKASDWAEEELKEARDNNLIPDVLDKTDMTLKITREEFVAVAVKFYEKLSKKTAIKSSENPFTDTDNIDVLKAYKLGITNGTSETTFSPNSGVTREEMATMLTRAIAKAGKKTNHSIEAKYADDAQISDWARDAIYYMTSIDGIKGIGENKYSPKTGASREEALAITQRVVNKF